jgi:hypothetical protein
MRIIKYLAIVTLSILLAVGAFACGGGGKNPIQDDTHNQNNTGGATLSGRVLDRERTPVGQPWVTVKLSAVDGSAVAPAQQPESTGPDAGKFEYLGLPIGIPMVLEIDLFQVSMGRNLGYIHQLTLTSSGTFNLGDIVLENDFLDMGWSSYVAKDYVTAVLNFNRSLEDRFVQANLSYSSSAYTGLGWVYGKRGKDNQTGLKYVDGTTGEWLGTINSYEWDQALLNFQTATANPKDSDAWVGMAGTYITLVGQGNKDPVLIGPYIYFYGFLHYYFPDAQNAIEKALVVDPDYECAHDVISADDLNATLLFLKWMQGQTVNPEQVSTLSKSANINEGSRQMLEALTDLILYNPYPQL